MFFKRDGTVPFVFVRRGGTAQDFLQGTGRPRCCSSGDCGWAVPCVVTLVVGGGGAEVGRPRSQGAHE